MAKKLEKQLEMRLIPKTEATKLVKGQADYEAKIAELRGQMGNQMTQAAARYGVNAAALRVARRYLKKPAAQAADFFLQLGYFWETLAIGQEQAAAPKRKRGRPAKLKVVEAPQEAAE